MTFKQGVLTNILLALTCFPGRSIYALPQPCKRELGASATLTLSSDTFASIQPASSGATQLPTSSLQQLPGTTGSIPTSLETQGKATSQPFVTATVTSPRAPLVTPNVVQSPLATSTDASCPAAGSGIFGNMSGDIDCFQRIATGPPASQIPSRDDHPLPRLGIVTVNSDIALRLSNQTAPISTNKFYANLFLGNQGQGVWTHPYSVSWSRGAGNAQSWGLAVSQIDPEQRAFGPPNNAIPGSPARYFINPLGIQSIVLSASELGSSTVLTTDSLQAFSVNANLQPQAGSGSSIKFPLVQGMGFVTALYTNLQPAVQSSIFFRGVVSGGSPRAGLFKYVATLEDGKTWLIYASSSNGQDPGLRLVSNTLLQGPPGWSGTIQVARNPAGADGEAKFDGSAGVYAAFGNVGGKVNGNTGTYTLSWIKAGLSTGQPLIMFALPHHVQSFDSNTRSHLTNIALSTTTKGTATAVVADEWTMVEPNLPTTLGFAPWSPDTGPRTSLSAAAISAINNVAASEVRQDMQAQSNLDSMYYSGKALSKFASIVYVIHDLVNDPGLAQEGLNQLKTAYARFATNQQIRPLVYDTAWKGVVSSASYTLHDPGVDFGNSYYNDHHFHYGYFIHAAAIIGYLDPGWLNGNKDWVNSLVRDVANPVQDEFFPFSRSFDWYHGHSWAKGLFESGDSKDEESSSEDVMFAYGMKLWGKITGDQSMEARGNLMLSILARSLQNYFLMASDNTVQPRNFIDNKVTGILFENKIDHTTYFGANFEYIQGIHMLPLVPASTLSRTKQFVTEEWNAYFRDGAVDPASNVAGGWRGILYANLAIIDPRASFNFFAQPNFDPGWLDGGASRTWYLAFAAGLGGA